MNDKEKYFQRNLIILCESASHKLVSKHNLFMLPFKLVKKITLVQHDFLNEIHNVTFRTSWAMIEGAMDF